MARPYIPLPPPFEAYCLSPHHPSDAAAKTEILNDISVAKWLIAPPFPYSIQNAEDFLKGVEARNAKPVPAGSGEYWKYPEVIRRIPTPNDPTPPFLGSLDFSIEMMRHIMDPTEQKQAAEENKARPLKDAFWEMGWFMGAESQGRGLMTAAIKTAINEWWIPTNMTRKAQLNIAVFDNNFPSRRTAEKNDFKIVAHMPDCIAFPEVKGGGRCGVLLMSWQGCGEVTKEESLYRDLPDYVAI